MFRELLDSFFGGAYVEPQSPLETLINDWRLVNMADRPEVDAVMIKRAMLDYMYEETLDAVSCFLRMIEELKPSNVESTEDSDGESECTNGEEEEKFSKRDMTDLDPSPTCLPSYQEPHHERFMINVDSRGRLRITEQEVVQHFQTVPVDDRIKDLFQYDWKDFEWAFVFREEEEDEYDLTMINELIRPEQEAEQEVPNNRSVLPRRYARMYSHVQDATSTDYTSLHKAEIQQRIHEVERGQKLKKYKSEKVINKGQLNRQNKNYLFQSSCKKNRRRDLQRRPSGAKNIRKC